jgi:deoxycytidylate deaminase
VIRHAFKCAARGRHPAHKHAALVVRGGSIISVGVNHDEVHAEVQALKTLWPSERRGTRIIVVRMTRGGRLGMSKPCKACENFMRASGVKSVQYSDADGGVQRMKL